MTRNHFREQQQISETLLTNVRGDSIILSDVCIAHIVYKNTSIKETDMISLNPSSNLLEQDPYRYALQDVPEPVLFREFFPYDETPKISFNHRLSPMGMPAEIWITDTTFRDGQQSRAPYTTEQIVALFKLMSRLGGPKGLIRQTEFFVYSKRDRDAVEQCMSLGLEFPEVTTWIRALKSDFRLVKDLGIKETGILVSCSDYHIFKKLGKTRKEALDGYLAVLDDALEVGIRPRCHLEDVTRADFYGFVVPFVNALMEKSREAKIPVKIRACDTMGYGVPYHGVAMPRSVPGLVYGLQHYSDVASELLEWHGHNDFHMGVANAVSAWLHGACAVNCTLLGIGERTGNVPLEAMVFQYASLKGSLDGMDSGVITEIADYYAHELNYNVPAMMPFIGKNFNVTRAGIHADGLLKDEEIYNIFNTQKLLNRMPLVAVSNTSGLAGIAYWINAYYNLGGESALDKRDPLVGLVKDWVDKQFSEGRETVISDEELVALIADLAPGRFS